jgi:hypothetical protein
MVYNNKFVAVVSCNGKILREVSSDNDVILPFGAEYSLIFKNLDDRRAVVEVSIDGVDVLDNRRIVVDANSSTELKGIMKGSTVKNAFKFIQKTEKIQDHRGDKIDDGFIRIKFGFERKIEKTITYSAFPNVYRSTEVRSFYYDSSNSSDVKYGGRSNERGISSNAEPMASTTISSSVTMDSLGPSQAPKAEEGITVPGSELKQDFSNTYVGSIEDHGTIVLRLKGTDKSEPVKTPIFVSTKKECPTCGTKSKHGTNFCPDCGTNLQA